MNKSQFAIVHEKRESGQNS